MKNPSPCCLNLPELLSSVVLCMHGGICFEQFDWKSATNKHKSKNWWEGLHLIFFWMLIVNHCKNVLGELEGTLMDTFLWPQVCIVLQGIWLPKSLELLEEYISIFDYDIRDTAEYLGWSMVLTVEPCRSHMKGAQTGFKKGCYDALCQYCSSKVSIALTWTLWLHYRTYLITRSLTCW